jgi:hypothetical protein
VLEVDSSGYPAVRSVVVVPRELSGRSLGSEAFEIQAGGASYPVEAVRLDADALELALVVDASVGDDDNFLRAQGALLEVPVHLPGASVAVVRSSRPATVVWPLTGDPVAASRAVRSMSPGGNPALVDGVASALNAFSTDTSVPPAGEATRRAVVLIAGDPAVDTYQMVAQAMRARDMGVTVYVITVADAVPVELDRLATLSSGRAVAVAPRDMVAAIDQTIADLRGQYRLRFSLSGEQQAGLDGQVPGEVVGAVGLRPAAASVNASGTSATVPLTIPPAAGAAADRPTGDTAAPPPEDTVWFPTVGMLLLVVVAALAVSRFGSWAARRHAVVGDGPRRDPPAIEAIDPIETIEPIEVDDADTTALVDSAGPSTR